LATIGGTEMNDEKITHEEARKLAFGMLPKQIGSPSSERKVKKYFELDKYFKQQEAQSKELEEYKISDKSKEESSIEYYNLYKDTKRRLAKVEELLRLYRSVYGVVQSWDTMPHIHAQIKQKEKELEELK